MHQRRHHSLIILCFLLLSACGGGGSSGSGGSTGTSSGSGTSAPPPPPAPSALSYPTPPALARSVAMALLAPTVSGAPDSYSVSPDLPAGISINTVSGIISGTPTAVSPSTTYTITATNAEGSTTTTVTLVVQTGFTYQVIVTAQGLPGDTLSYQWSATDGTIQNVNAPQTTWIAPTGPGEHFVYVLVGNGNGGYAESRVAINTDSLGTAAFVPAPVPYETPSANTPAYPPYRFFLVNPIPVQIAPAETPAVLASGYSLNLENLVSFQPLFPNVLIADGKGSVAVQSLLLSSIFQYDVNCGFPPNVTSQGECSTLGGSDFWPPTYQFVTAPQNAMVQTPAPYVPTAFGHVTLADGNLAGINDPFFGVNVTATASYQNCNGFPVVTCSSVPVNDFGDFSLPLDIGANLQSGQSIAISAEQSSAVSVPVATDSTSRTYGQYLNSVTLPGTAVPVISAMSASSDGATQGRPQSVWPNAISAPSDHIAQNDIFLSFKGSDTRTSACQYYQAIGALPSGQCDPTGHYSGAINFEDWKKAVAIDQYATNGAATTTAVYVNAVDLNLTREHHSISYGPNQVGTYVCNHPGPVDASNDPINVSLPTPSSTDQPALDTAVNNALTGQNLVACVAMDYVVTPGSNGNQPFTRFLIFGPSGELLPSVNLDGRGEKFVPGACVACHGGDHYMQKYPEDGSGPADVGAHFLPYDAGNFAFSSVSGHTKADLQPAIYQLNQNILNTNVTPATQALIAGWYASGKTLDESYVPNDWKTYDAAHSTSNALAVYTNVVARSCRTCHTALSSYNWDSNPPVPQPQDSPFLIGGPGAFLSFVPQVVCGANPTNRILNYSMPNSLVTFNRFWNSQGSGATTDQTALLAQFAGTTLLPAGCALK